MRAWFIRGTVLAALGAAIACAASEDQDSSPPAPDGGNTTLGDGGAADAVTDASIDHATTPDAEILDAAPNMCSEAGWCLTKLPDTNLWVQDVQAFETTAFATGFNFTIGPKVVEWGKHDGQAASWKYIDDDTQQESPGDISSFWAPNENEVYYAYQLRSTVRTGSFGAYLYHGRRPVAPATNWTWTSTRFDCGTNDAAIVTGVGSDVYMLHCKKIHRLTGDPDADAGLDSHGGPASWTVEYTDDDTAALTFQGRVGTPGDAWFVGKRDTACSVIIRKTADGYQRIADGIASGTTCTPKPGVPAAPAFLQFVSPVAGEIVGTTGMQGKASAAKLTLESDGGLSVATSKPRADLREVIWTDTRDELWLVANYGYLLLQGKDVWSDAAAYNFSTLVINGVPNDCQFYKLSGTSKSNLWGVGANCAYHKTTP
ncbi:hypothetical protein AKJ09_04486 [Labilithrix luteola]|uniref:Uncharacterized protein n=1 Tax=Labilithrix luteola TaxID=1391654 RepID=A0A0K1PWC9_9BACT|nr:hypothetical protein [Labilithrix luteola]AKU97822.1 hypothetical protein AKJ09_04486 [Labilithrix luteola]